MSTTTHTNVIYVSRQVTRQLFSDCVYPSNNRYTPQEKTAWPADKIKVYINRCPWPVSVTIHTETKPSFAIFILPVLFHILCLALDHTLPQLRKLFPAVLLRRQQRDRRGDGGWKYGLQLKLAGGNGVLWLCVSRIDNPAIPTKPRCGEGILLRFRLPLSVKPWFVINPAEVPLKTVIVAPDC